MDLLSNGVRYIKVDRNGTRPISPILVSQCFCLRIKTFFDGRKIDLS